jgi:hypothetical protein
MSDFAIGKPGDSRSWCAGGTLVAPHTIEAQMADEKSGSSNAKAQLGCGTLILIGIIVAAFSGRGEISELRDDVSALRDQVTRLETKIDSLNVRLEAVRVP